MGTSHGDPLLGSPSARAIVGPGEIRHDLDDARRSRLDGDALVDAGACRTRSASTPENRPMVKGL